MTTPIDRQLQLARVTAQQAAEEATLTRHDTKIASLTEAISLKNRELQTAQSRNTVLKLEGISALFSGWGNEGPRPQVFANGEMNTRFIQTSTADINQLERDLTNEKASRVAQQARVDLVRLELVKLQS